MKKSKTRIGRRKKQQMKRLMFKIGAAGAALIVILTALYLYLNNCVTKYPENKVVENIYVGAIDAGGMTKAGLKEALELHYEETKTTKVTLVIDGSTEETTLEELGYGYKNIDKLVKEAFSYGKDGSIWKRYRALRKISKENLVIEEEYVIDSDMAKAVLKEKAVPHANHAKDATIAKTSEGFKITEEKEGETVDIKKTISSLKKYLNEEWKYKDIKLDVVLKKETPSVKAADLESIQDELGSFSTDAGSGTRWQNLKTGVGKFDGLVLMPGEEVSAYGVTGPYDEEHGYVAAGSYENGQVVDTYGGGICQVSSTLYNALLDAEIEIVKRYPHSMLVSYVEPSKDAAIAAGIKDLVFKNNYETPIYIKGEIDSNNQLNVTIYGKETRPENREVKYETEIISTTDYETVYKADYEASIGSMQGGARTHIGKEARLWKIVYENGKEVERKDINYSEYQKSDYVISVGTKSSVSAASSLVANAIATQDSAKIKQAISEAQAMIAGAGSQDTQ